MNAQTREQVRANAKYLRQVRPIDPEEIAEYVESQPHPAVVRRILQEEAPDLGLVERADGTFVPVADGPVDAGPVETVRALPERYADTLLELLVGKWGTDWATGESGDRLRERIRELKERYLRGAPVEYDDLTALAYAVYHLPAYYAAGQYVFGDLAADGLLPAHLRVLDVGAGVGGPALGLLDLLPEDALVAYHAVEPGAGADVLEAMLAEAGRNVHPTVHRTTAEAFDPAAVEFGDGPDPRSEGAGGFDVALFGNVLSELDDPAAVVRRYLDALAPDGTLVALAPADRNTATGLREVERAVADDGPATVYAPTLRLWPGQSPASESWSFDVKPDLAVPRFQERLDEGAGGPEHDEGEFVNVDVQYALSVLRRDGRRRLDLTADRSRFARLADAEEFVTERVNLLAVKLSHDLSEGGNPLYLLGDGSQQTDVFAVHTDPSVLNRDLAEADYGDVLAFERALVLWNDDEEAHNVVVDADVIVDRVG